VIYLNLINFLENQELSICNFAFAAPGGFL
jgi:hypothetical protein